MTSNYRFRSAIVAGRPLLLLFGGTFGSASFSLFAQLLLARSIDIADYGRLATVLAAVTLLSPIATFGVNWFWIQAFGREGSGGFRWISPSYALLLVTNALSIFLLIGYFSAYGNLSADNQIQEVFFAIGILLGQSLIELSSATFLLEEKFGSLALWQSLAQLGRFLIAIFLVLNRLQSLYAILAGYGLVGLLLFGAGFHILRNVSQRGLKLAGHKKVAASTGTRHTTSPFNVAKLSFPFAFITIVYLIYFQGVLLIVASLLGPEPAAIFSAAMLILSAINLIPNIVFTKFLMGRIFRWAEHNREKYKAVFHLSVAGMTVLGVLIMIAICLLAPLVISLAFPTKFSGAVNILIWLSPTIPLRFVQSAYSAMLVSDLDVRRRVAYAAFGVMIGVTANLACLPRFGLIGAAIAANLSEASIMLVTLWGARRQVSGIRLGAMFKLSAIKAAAKILSAREH